MIYIESYDNDQIIKDIDQRFNNLMNSKQKFFVYMPSKNKPLKSPIFKTTEFKMRKYSNK